MTPYAKYAAAFIQLAIVLVGALAQLAGPVSLTDGLQLVPLAANVLFVYLLPLFGPDARSGWKTGIAVVMALATAAIPYASTGHITGAQVAVVLLAGLQALGAHIGVQVRNNAAAAPMTARTSLSGSEPPTSTTINQAIDANGGEFLGTPAR